MKFKGEPNLFIRVMNPRPGEVKSFSFDKDGFYETDNPITIKRLQNAGYKEVKEELKKESEEKKLACKQCGFEAENTGKLLAHIKKEHPKK